jgi:hypothetical protein
LGVTKKELEILMKYQWELTEEEKIIRKSLDGGADKSHVNKEMLGVGLEAEK